MSRYGVRDERERVAFNPSHLDDYGLDPYEFRVYMRLVRRAGTSEGTAYESIGNTAKACVMSERKVRYAIKVLCALELVRVVEEGRDSPSVYAITQSARWRAPRMVTELREAALQPDPARKTKHKGVAPDAAPTPAQYAAPPAHDAAPPLHDMQPPPAPHAAKGTPMKVAPLEGTPMKVSSPTGDALAKPEKAHPKHAPPPEYADLYGVWNQHRGALPESINNEAVNKLLKAAVKKYDRADLLVLLEQGTQEVATDSYWHEHRYGLTNLLRNLDSKAEAYRSRGGLAPVDAKAKDRYRSIQEALGV